VPSGRPGDIDVTFIRGYGWPPYKGGPLFYAEKYVTLPLLLQRLETFSKIYPNSDYYKPAKLLETMVKVGITVFDIQLNPSILRTLMDKINEETHILKSFL